jgi:hypothetical protein
MGGRRTRIRTRCFHCSENVNPANPGPEKRAVQFPAPELSELTVSTRVKVEPFHRENRGSSPNAIERKKYTAVMAEVAVTSELISA